MIYKDNSILALTAAHIDVNNIQQGMNNTLAI